MAASRSLLSWSFRLSASRSARNASVVRRTRASTAAKTRACSLWVSSSRAAADCDADVTASAISTRAFRDASSASSARRSASSRAAFASNALAVSEAHVSRISSKPSTVFASARASFFRKSASRFANARAASSSAAARCAACFSSAARTAFSVSVFAFSTCFVRRLISRRDRRAFSSYCSRILRDRAVAWSKDWRAFAKRASFSFSRDKSSALALSRGRDV